MKTFILFILTSLIAIEGHSQETTYSITPVSIQNEMTAQERRLAFNYKRQPEFPGGSPALQAFFSRHLQYPSKDRKAERTGVVIVQITLDKNGKVVSAKSLKGPSPELMDEVERVVLAMPDWRPGWQGGQTVKTKFNIAVSLELM